MSKLTKISTGLLLCATLNACGSGGDDSDLSFTQQQTSAGDFADQIEDLAAIDPADLPTSGTVDYNGIFATSINTDEADEVVFLGDLALSADFVTDAVTGDLSNVNSSEGLEYDGTIALTDGAINRGAAISETVTGAVVGDVVTSAGNTVSFDTELSGDFLGEDSQYLAGDITGTIEFEGVEQTIVENSGAFVTEVE